jgi:hypothetical protein
MIDCAGASEKGADTRRICGVERVGGDVAQRLFGGREPLRIASGDRDPMAGVTQPPRRGEADAG